MSAKLDVESVTEPGVFVKAEAKVVALDRVEVTMGIINKTERLTLGDIRPLYCFQYKDLTGFPRWVDNLKHTFFLKGGKLTALADIQTPKDSRIKAGSVIGSPQQNDSPFAAGAGGWIDSGVDASITVLTSLDNSHTLVLGWTPGKSAFTNSSIPCVHADPYYGSIAPGGSATAKAVIVLTDKPKEEVVKQLVAEGVGAPVKK